MLPSYEEVYAIRAKRYHRAMQRFPEARENEFRRLLSLSKTPICGSVLDAPSGGGYLASFLDLRTCRVVEVDPVEGFLQGGGSGPQSRSIVAPLSLLPFKDEAFDWIISLAGIHHTENKLAVFREWRRLLRPGGTLLLADVGSPSPVARFLDVFVNEHNPDGHRGAFLDQTTRWELGESGFTIESDCEASCPWKFKCTTDLAAFTRNLFGLRPETTDKQIHEGAVQFLGFRPDAVPTLLPWKLDFISAR